MRPLLILKYAFLGWGAIGLIFFTSAFVIFFYAKITHTDIYIWSNADEDGVYYDFAMFKNGELLYGVPSSYPTQTPGETEK